MEAFFIYFLKSSGIILLFLACYRFFLNRETFYLSTRYFLLLGLVLALLLPLVSYTKTVWIEIPMMDVPIVESSIPEITNEFVPQIELASILFAVYVIGVLLGTIRLLVQLLSLRKVFRNSCIVKEGKFKVLESNKPLQPFSFFNTIIYHPKSHSEKDIKAILAHEKIHSKQYHSIDILVMHLFTIFQWCNPFIYFYKFYLKENLEFIADANTISTAIQKENYQYLLVKSTMGEKHFDFVNPFFNSSIKKRIVMLNKKKSKKRSSIKYALVVPLLIGFVLLFNVETVAKIRTISPSIISAELDAQLIDPKVYSISKDASDDEIEALKKEVKKEQGELTIENLKRNSSGKIISISITYKVKEGGSTTGNYNEENNINTIHFGQNEKGGLFISTDETKLSELKKGVLPKIQSQQKRNATVYSINKNTSDKELKQIKSTIEKKGGEFSYSHKRNSKGEIIDLEFEIYHNGTGNFKSTPPFEKCYFGTLENGGIFLADDEKGFNSLNLRNAKDSKGLGNKSRELKNDKFNEVTYDKEKSGDFPVLATFNYKKDRSIGIPNGGFLNYRSSSGPIYYVNGVETPLKLFSTISPENIESITVLKSEAAVSIYGEKGENGVVNIKTKEALYPDLNSLKVPDLVRVGSNQANDSIEKSPWKVSAGLSPKNQDKMSVSELHEYYQEKSPENLQQDIDAALIIVDGKEMSKNEFDKIPAKQIESISVLKGAAAKKKYGKKGKNGVVEVVTKKSQISIKTPNTNIHLSQKPNDLKLNIDGKEPLIILDGKEISRDALDKLDPKKIKSMSVLKDESAEKKYGKKGKNGVIEIVLKSLKKSIQDVDNDYHKSIGKTTTKEQLKNMRQEMLKNEIEVAFEKVERNQKGEIVKIIISVKDKISKTKVTASFANKNKPIPNILVGRINNTAKATSSF